MVAACRGIHCRRSCVVTAVAPQRTAGMTSSFRKWLYCYGIIKQTTRRIPGLLHIWPGVCLFGSNFHAVRGERPYGDG
jgi:hypothetical protein